MSRISRWFLFLKEVSYTWGTESESLASYGLAGRTVNLSTEIRFIFSFSSTSSLTALIILNNILFIKSLIIRLLARNVDSVLPVYLTPS